METETKLSRSYNAEIHFYTGERTGPCIPLHDLIRAVFEQSPKEQRISMAQFLVAQVEFGQAVEELLGGYSNEEWHGEESSGDTLRKTLIPFADTAAKELIKTAFESNQRLRQRVADLTTHIRKMEQEWPEPYKRYLPKPDITCCSTTFLTDDDAQRLIAFVKTKEAAI